MLCRKTGIRMGLYQHDFKYRILLSQIASRAKAGAAGACHADQNIHIFSVSCQISGPVVR